MASKPAAASAPNRYERFVAETMDKRIPAILRIAQEGLPEEAVKQLRAIARAIEANGPMVLGLEGWPFGGWEDLPGRVNGKRPRQAPFFDFEYWMYYRILQSVRFAQTRLDPFRVIKHRDLDKNIAWAETALAATPDFQSGLKLSLDANAHDLSQIAKPESSHQFGRELLDIDPSEVNRLNIIADNFGVEFLGDLILAILSAEHGMEVVIHVKQLPMFVSDTTTDDVTILLDHMSPDTAFAQRLSKAVRQGLIRFASNPVWSAPCFLDKLPTEELGTGPRVLTLLKGDLNFRRAIGDVVVDIGTPFEQLPVLPAMPMLSLRSIKSYCVAGITAWPEGVSRTDFPMDGSIVAVQRIPNRGAQFAPDAPPARAPAARAPSLARLRTFIRRNGG